MMLDFISGISFGAGFMLFFWSLEKLLTAIAEERGQPKVTEAEDGK